jgi:small subunit ribosomal protein S6
VRPYETMIIFDVDVEDTAINAVIDRALEILRSHGGQPGQVERWGKRTFAYELRHKREGYYVLVSFSAEPAATAEFDRYLSLADEVMRHKVVHLPPQAAGRRRPSSGRPAPAASVPTPAPTEAH